MVDLDDPNYAEMLRRFETEMDVEKSRDTDDLFRKFRFWAGELTPKQETLLRSYAKEKGIPEKTKPRLIVRPKITRQTFMRRGKPITVYRDAKGRFAKRG